MNWRGGFANMFQNWSKERQAMATEQREFDRQNKLENSRMMKQKELYSWQKQQETEALQTERTRLEERGVGLGYSGAQLERFVNSGGQEIPVTDEEYDKDTARQVKRGTALGGAEIDLEEEKTKRIGQIKRDMLKDDVIAQVEAKMAGQDVMLQGWGIDPNSQTGKEMKKELGGIKSKAAQLSPDKKADLWIKANEQTAKFLETADEDVIIAEFGSMQAAQEKLSMDFFMIGTALVQPKPKTEAQVVNWLAQQPKNVQEQKLQQIEEQDGPEKADKMRTKISMMGGAADRALQEQRGGGTDYTGTTDAPAPEKDRASTVKEQTLQNIGRYKGFSLWNWLKTGWAKDKAMMDARE